MPEFHFYYPIKVRYADLDPQGHVNNAIYLTYFEEARSAYIQHLELWDGKTFLDLPVILAETRVVYRAPVLLNQKVHIGVSVVRLGNKSFTMEYALEDQETGRTLAQATTVQVAYDYHQERTIPIPPAWRKAIEAFESLISESK
jgi:acyl-CoA thioester hydrolase